VAIGGPALIDARNPDFIILRYDPAVIALLVGVVALFGLVVVLADAAIERRAPRPGDDPADYALGALGLALLGGIVAIPLLLGLLLSPAACPCRVLPIPIGVPLVLVGLATLAVWVRRVRGQADTPPGLRIVGRSALLATGGLGATVLATNVADLLL
jgi:hypothetical protein